MNGDRVLFLGQIALRMIVVATWIGFGWCLARSESTWVLALFFVSGVVSLGLCEALSEV